MFGGDYHRHPLQAEERPKCGIVNAFATPGGAGKHYGTCMLVLKDSVRKRSTLTSRDMSTCGVHHLGTFDDLDNVIRFMHPDSLKAAMEVALGRRRATTSYDLHYVELQVHGPIEFSKDVAKLVIDQRYAGSVYAKKMQLFAKKHGIPLWWHDGNEATEDARGKLR